MQALANCTPDRAKQGDKQETPLIWYDWMLLSLLNLDNAWGRVWMQVAVMFLFAWNYAMLLLAMQYGMCTDWHSNFRVN
jgi:hypothetical protein